MKSRFNRARQIVILSWKAYLENRYLKSLTKDPAPIFAIVTKHINAWDPMELIAIGCPPDEYHSEIKTICVYILKQADRVSTIELTHYMVTIFSISFDVHIVNEAKVSQFAESIYREVIDNSNL